MLESEMMMRQGQTSLACNVFKLAQLIIATAPSGPVDDADCNIG